MHDVGPVSATPALPAKPPAVWLPSLSHSNQLSYRLAHRSATPIVAHPLPAETSTAGVPMRTRGIAGDPGRRRSPGPASAASPIRSSSLWPWLSGVSPAVTRCRTALNRRWSRCLIRRRIRRWKVGDKARRLVVAMTAATGAALGIRLLEALADLGVETRRVVTELQHIAANGGAQIDYLPVNPIGPTLTPNKSDRGGRRRTRTA